MEINSSVLATRKNIGFPKITTRIKLLSTLMLPVHKIVKI